MAAKSMSSPALAAEPSVALPVAPVTEGSAVQYGLTPENREARKGLLTASEWAASLGYHPDKTALSVYLEKIGELPPFEGNERTELGQLLEDPILEAGARKLGIKIQRNKDLVIHPSQKWAAATPDGFSGELVVEAKNVGSRVAHRWDEGVPAYVDIQTRVQMACSGAPRAIVVALVGGSDLRTFEVERDPDYEANLFKLGMAFMQRVWLKEPPTPSADDLEYLKAKYPRSSGKLLDATDADMSLVAAYSHAKAAADAAEEAVDSIRARLVERIGAADGIAGLCTYRSARDSQVTDWEGVLRALNVSVPADVIAKHTKARAGSRRLLLSKGVK